MCNNFSIIIVCEPYGRRDIRPPQVADKVRGAGPPRLLNVAEDAGHVLRSFRCPAAGCFGPLAQQPTGLTLPFAPAGVSDRAPRPYGAAFFASVASVRRTQETRLTLTPGIFQRTDRRERGCFPKKAAPFSAVCGRQDIRLPFSILSHHGMTILQTKIYLCHSLPQGF